MIDQKMLFEYIKDKFETNIENNAILEKEYRLEWYDKLGRFGETEVDDKEYNQMDDNLITIIIEHTDIELDISLPKNVYSLEPKLTVLTKEENLDDITEIIRSFIFNHKTVLAEIDGEQMIMSIEQGWDQDTIILQGERTVVAEFTIGFILFRDLMLSNDVTMELDGVNIEYNEISIAIDTEMVPDLRKRIKMGSIPNTEILQINVIGLMSPNNKPLRDILRNVRNSDMFNRSVNCSIIYKRGAGQENGELSLFSAPLYVKSSEFKITRGSLVTFIITLVIYSDI